MKVDSLSKQELFSFIENTGKFKIDSYIENAAELAEDIHQGVTREDGTSSFLETHVWPVTRDVISHYKNSNKPITTVEIVSAILHDVLEDDERILDVFKSKEYGFEAYFRHRFGDYVFKRAMTLKRKSLYNYPGENDEQREFERFADYCNTLHNSEYAVKVIKLADRINNMRFVRNVANSENVNRYIREAESFFIAYTILIPRTDDFYSAIRDSYNDLLAIQEGDKIKESSTITRKQSSS